MNNKNLTKIGISALCLNKIINPTSCLLIKREGGVF